jgi:hypothetical protein
VSLRLRITYQRTADFLMDVEQQLSRRGLLVRVEAGELERGAPVELAIVTPVGRAVVPAAVLQPLGPAGLAVELDPALLEPLIAKVRGAEPFDGDPPKHERITGDDPAPGDGEPDADEPDAEPEPRAAARTPGSVAQQQAQQIQIALHGDKNQRMAILRTQNRMLHSYVLKNPQIQLEEIVFVARMSTAAPDTLASIANRREWAERPEVAIALVRNPKTPVPLAIKMLDHVAPDELRNLAKQPNVREQIQRAARKKVLG